MDMSLEMHVRITVKPGQLYMFGSIPHSIREHCWFYFSLHVTIIYDTCLNPQGHKYSDGPGAGGVNNGNSKSSLWFS